MNKKTRSILALSGITAVGIIMVGRRLALDRRGPCPHWLTVLLENPYFNAVAGAETILNRIDLQPGMHVLDVGCGPGRLIVPTASRVLPGGSVTGLDIQAGMLAKADQKVQASGLNNVTFIQASIGSGSATVNTFDRALLVTVLGEISDQKAALAEIHQALKVGGLLSVTEVLPDPHYQTPTTVRQLAVDAGFEETKYYGRLPAYTLNFIKPPISAG